VIAVPKTRFAGRVLLWGAFGAIAGGAATSLAVRARAESWSVPSPDPALVRAGTLGPPAGVIVRSARRELRDLLGPGGARGSYLVRLGRIKDWYRQAALLAPLDGPALLGLATVGCETDILTQGAPGEKCEGLLRAATDRERLNAAYQLHVAEIHLRIGEFDRGSELAARVVASDPSASAEAFHLLQSFGVGIPDAVNALGAGPSVVLAARDSYQAEGRTADYLTLLESGIDGASRAFLETYREVGFRARAFDRVVGRLSGAAENSDRDAEATRLRILAEAHLARGDGRAAAEPIRAAMSLAPKDPLVLEVCGDGDVARGQVVDGQSKYRDALGIVARSGASAGQMGRLYRKIGECWERLGDGAHAFDSYRKSLELAPDDLTSAARLRAITHPARTTR